MTDSAARPIRVGLADKNPLIRAALKQLLSEDSRFELVHVAADCEEFLNNIEKAPVDVGVIGWIIGPCDGRYILDHLNAETRAPRIVVYTGHESRLVPSLVLAHGGAAFVAKSEQPAVLLDTVASVAAGRMVFPYMDVRAINENPLTTLTRRELEVVVLVSTGLTNRELAAKLGVARATADKHVTNILRKLGLVSRADVRGWALAQGLTDAP